MLATNVRSTRAREDDAGRSEAGRVEEVEQIVEAQAGRDRVQYRKRPDPEPMNLEIVRDRSDPWSTVSTVEPEGGG